MDMIERLEYENKQRARALKEFPHWKRLASALQELNYTVTAHVRKGDKHDPHLRDAENNVIRGIAYHAIRDRGVMRRYSFAVDGPRTKNFRELKAGGHNYTGIAQALVDSWDAQNDQQERRNIASENSVKCKVIREELGFDNAWCDIDGFNVKHTDYESTPFRMTFEMSKAGDADDARAMFKLLKEAGFINND